MNKKLPWIHAAKILHNTRKGGPVIKIQWADRINRKVNLITAAHLNRGDNGEPIEVLGTYNSGSNGEHLRLRFSRFKYYLGLGSLISPDLLPALTDAALIPPYPHELGGRIKSEYDNKIDEIKIDTQSLLDLRNSSEDPLIRRSLRVLPGNSN